MPKSRSTLVDTAIRWSQHCRSLGCRFDVEGKAAEAIAFTLSCGGRSFAIPSKLEGVKPHQRTLATLRTSGHWQEIHLLSDEGHVVTAVWKGLELGTLRPKHRTWALPLLHTGLLRCYVLDVTGGGEKGLYGCNIVLSGIGEAFAAQEQAAPVALAA